MTTQLFFTKLYPLLMGWLMITGSFYLTKSFILDDCLKRNSASTSWQQIQGYATSLIIPIIIAALIDFSGPKNLFLIYAIPLVIPAVAGTMAAYDIDAKWTPEERIEAQNKKRKDEWYAKQRGIEE